MQIERARVQDIDDDEDWEEAELKFSLIHKIRAQGKKEENNGI